MIVWYLIIIKYCILWDIEGWEKNKTIVFYLFKKWEYIRRQVNNDPVISDRERRSNASEWRRWEVWDSGNNWKQIRSIEKDLRKERNELVSIVQKDWSLSSWVQCCICPSKCIFDIRCTYLQMGLLLFVHIMKIVRREMIGPKLSNDQQNMAWSLYHSFCCFTTDSKPICQNRSEL